MSRKQRPDVPGGWHHVVNRGRCGGDVFFNDGDRLLFLRYLGDAAIRYEVEVIAYCLMGNHYHLVLHCPEGGLSATLRHSISRYVQGFNRRHGLEGSLFKGRFYSKLITDDSQVLATTRYVHRNPLDIGQDIRTYRWSSYAAYLNGGDDNPWLFPDLPLQLLGGPSHYRGMVETSWPSDKRSAEPVIPVRRSNKPVERSALVQVSQQVRAGLQGQVVSKPMQRQITALILVDQGHATGEVAKHLGFASAASVRKAVFRARAALAGDPVLGDVVDIGIKKRLLLPAA